MAKRRSKPEPIQFEYRVRKSVDCIIAVEAASQEQADAMVQDPSNWVYEHELEMPDFEVRGKA